MLRLHHHPMSTASRFVRLVLGEYGERAEMLEERPWERRKEFLALNPAATLPILIEDNGPPIVGGVVIGEYLDETRGAFQRDRRLLAEKPIERAEMRRLTEWFLLKLEAEVTRYLVRERVYKLDMRPEEGGGPPDAAAIRAARANLKHHLRYVGWLAESRNWLAGPRLSYADFSAAAAFSILDYLGEIAWEKEPAAKEWYVRIKSRPSFRPFLTERVRGIPPVPHYAELDF
ncbi:glutathione S-transferase family protein [Mangrovibrevibacter kandeliae]|uniref:glutathione S-transferase family protein n=1 Tax=Mangrovibrevibacter kandeliae TaxID=2968473 RepID=UPI00211996C7|nr:MULTISPECIES: glutathione S-transferase family protein [unclassified Aurantimonas]MCQ8782367.1 glutathione S-transferase family protein [Aurantimonas sp. CSK15Z-1]MCW4114986.1 glutathione S-transferase family protein [Aurantimonas sp. MSK8Z-1]